MKQLFILFKKRGIQYNYKTDFNNDGEFHGVTLAMWEKAKEGDDKFGTN